MGPTNVALVKLFRADQALREAQGRLDAASKNVRIQERKVSDLTERAKTAQNRIRELQSKAGQFELDIKTREARIEKLRSQQQNATNNKEYQAFLLEISTEKVDRGKSEDELLKLMEQVEKQQAEQKEIAAQQEAEEQKLAAMRAQIGDNVATLKAEVESLRPARDEALAALPQRHRVTFERLAERYEGEALSALQKPDRRREEYLCSACMMDLVADVYNRLHTRDDMIFCTSCGRVLYIPEDLPPEVAINSRGKSESREPSTLGAVKQRKAPRNIEKLDPTERRAKGKLGDLLSKAQGESVKIALDAEMKPVECDVIVDGKSRGVYKGKSAEHLQRIVMIRFEEAGMKGTVEVIEKPASEVPALATEAALAETANASTPAEAALETSAPHDVSAMSSPGPQVEPPRAQVSSPAEPPLQSAHTSAKLPAETAATSSDEEAAEEVESQASST